MSDKQDKIDQIVSETAYRILHCWDEWEVEAEQICHSEQNPAPYADHMMRELTDVINLAANNVRSVLIERDNP